MELNELMQFIMEENRILEGEILQSRQRWANFWSRLITHQSPIKIDGRAILPPLMTAEKHRDMQMYRNQACITEVRLKARAREREFLDRVQKSYEDIQEGDILQRDVLYTETKSIKTDSTNDNASASQTDTSLQSPGSAELPSESVTLPVSPSISRKGSTSDSENDHQPLIKLVRAPRIHRRRRTDSGGSTGSEASVIRPEGGARPESEAALTRTGSERSLRHALHRRSIEQAVMNSSTSLRRTGSERALKRTGSEKALRRTGSGDIPAAIPSESNPRMTHKRSGSGDTATLNIPKDRAINKLTRSYDMSIRSLMSEEFNQKVKSEPQPREPQQYGSSDSLYKCLSSSPAAKEPVIILSRPSQSIKKSPPKQDVGPPQPIKAIHCLPPSRENTFESTLPRPLFPDLSENLPSEKVVVADSLDVVSIGSEETDKETGDVPGVSSMPEESPVTGAKSQQTETELRAEQKPDESARPALTKPLLVKVPTIPATNSPISPGHMHLPNPYSAGDHLTQDWLLEKISELHSAGEVNVGDWLQNAPDRLRSQQTSPNSAATENFPCPEKSNSLPLVRNKAESTPSPNVRPHTALPTTGTTNQDQQGGPAANERKKAAASKSYIVNNPSPALLDSLNESQKSIIETSGKRRNSNGSSNKEKPSDVPKTDTPTRLVQPTPTVSPCNKKSPANDGKKTSSVRRSNSLGRTTFSTKSDSANSSGQTNHKTESRESVGRRLAQRKLDYTSADKQSPIQSRSQVQKYLQQYGITNNTKQAWGAKTTPDSSPDKESSKENSPQPYTCKVPAERIVSDNQSTKEMEAKEDMLTQVRRELSLLKAKHASKLSPRDTNERPGSAEPATTKHTPDFHDRPSTAMARMSPHTHKQHNTTNWQYHHAVFGTTEKNLALLREGLQSSPNAKAVVFGASHVKSFLEKEATPIPVSLGQPLAVNDSISSEYSLYGGIHSATHPRPSTAQSVSSGQVIHHNASAPSSLEIKGRDRLVACIRGHLCRRLLASAKVKSIIKTIKDCKSLLPESFESDAANPRTLHEIRFQERLLDQWQAALMDIHEIFFELPTYKRIDLIRQSELAPAQAKLKAQKIHAAARNPTRKAQSASKKKVSAATQKVMERKKAQKTVTDSSNINSKTVVLKKAVLAPTFAAQSPKRSQPIATGRVTKNYVRTSPVRKSNESPRKRIL